MQIAKFDFAEKAAALKAIALTLDSEYSQAARAHWLTLNSLKNTYDNLAGAANKLENAPQNSVRFLNLIQVVIAEIQEVEALIADVDIEKVRIDAAYAGSQLEKARLANKSAEAINQLSISITASVKAIAAVNEATERRNAFTAPERPKKKIAVVKADFTHTKGGGAVQFHKGGHCTIDHESPDGSKVIADTAGNWAVPFTADEVARLFDVIEQ